MRQLRIPVSGQRMSKCVEVCRSEDVIWVQVSEDSRAMIKAFRRCRQQIAGGVR